MPTASRISRHSTGGHDHTLAIGHTIPVTDEEPAEAQSEYHQVLPGTIDPSAEVERRATPLDDWAFCAIAGVPTQAVARVKQADSYGGQLCYASGSSEIVTFTIVSPCWTASTTSWPSITWPKTECLPSRCGVGT